jgi:hypothetical protein
MIHFCNYCVDLVLLSSFYFHFQKMKRVGKWVLGGIVDHYYFFLYLQPLLWCYIYTSLKITKWYELRPKKLDSWAKKLIVMIVFNNTKIIRHSSHTQDKNFVILTYTKTFQWNWVFEDHTPFLHKLSRYDIGSQGIFEI